MIDSTMPMAVASAANFLMVPLDMVLLQTLHLGTPVYRLPPSEVAPRVSGAVPRSPEEPWFAVNVLFVTLDQFRADSYGAAGHPVVATPTLDRLAAEGVRLTKHFSQAAPCSPGRAALYTGMYQMNNRVVANGSPLDASFDNVAKMVRRAGFTPTLFGYTDQGQDPRTATGPDDPRLDNYDGILPGFEVGCYLPENQAPWRTWLESLGYEVPPGGWHQMLVDEPSRPAEHSLSAFLTNEFCRWLDAQPSGWFAHLSYLRPHPPYSAAGHFSERYDPAEVELPIAPVDAAHREPNHSAWLSIPAAAAPTDEEGQRQMRAQYYGMIAEIDSRLGQVVAAIEARGEWDETVVLITADHGEQLGDHGLKEKLGYFPQSYHIIGIWRDPFVEASGITVEAFTENVDLFPTLCERLGQPIPRQVDGRSLLALFDGTAKDWRTAAHYEWDWRYVFIGADAPGWPEHRFLERQNLAAVVNDELAYVQFGDGSSLCFDLVADPTWRTPQADPAKVLEGAKALLQWRQEHLGRQMTDLLLTAERPGVWPEVASGLPTA